MPIDIDLFYADWGFIRSGSARVFVWTNFLIHFRAKRMSVRKIRKQWTFDSMVEPDNEYYKCFCKMHSHVSSETLFTKFLSEVHLCSIRRWHHCFFLGSFISFMCSTISANTPAFDYVGDIFGGLHWESEKKASSLYPADGDPGWLFTLI